MAVVLAVGSAITTSLTTFVDVTGLTFSVAPSTNYYFRFVLHHSSSATTTGIRFAVNGPASPTAVRVGGHVPITTAAANPGSAAAYDTAVFASTTATTVATMSIVEGILRNGSNGGTLACRVAAEVAANVIVLANSTGMLVS